MSYFTGKNHRELIRWKEPRCLVGSTMSFQEIYPKAIFRIRTPRWLQEILRWRRQNTCLKKSLEKGVRHNRLKPRSENTSNPLTGNPHRKILKQEGLNATAKTFFPNSNHGNALSALGGRTGPCIFSRTSRKRPGSAWATRFQSHARRGRSRRNTPS